MFRDVCVGINLEVFMMLECSQIELVGKENFMVRVIRGMLSQCH